MITVVVQDTRTDHVALALGLTRAECVRLLQGTGIDVALADVVADHELHAHEIRVVLFAAESETSVTAQLERLGVTNGAARVRHLSWSDPSAT